MSWWRGAHSLCAPLMEILACNFAIARKWVASYSLRLLWPRGNNIWYPLNRRLAGPQSRFGRCVEEKNLLSLPRFTTPSPSHYTYWAIAAALNYLELHKFTSVYTSGLDFFLFACRPPPRASFISVPPPHLSYTLLRKNKKLLHFHVVVQILDSNIRILIIPANVTVMQRQEYAPTLCLSLFSKICLILKLCLGLKRKQEDFCTAGYAGDRETFHSVLHLKYFTQAVKFRWPTQKLLWLPDFPLGNFAWPPERLYGLLWEPLVCTISCHTADKKINVNCVIKI
jgi:hypothetical protein